MAITNYSPRELTLSVSEKRGTQYVYAKQGDALSRNLSITLVDDDSALTFGSGERAAIRVLKPDGTSRAENATIGNDGVISVELSDQILAVSGLISADIVIYSGTTIILSSEVFTIEAEAAPIGVNAVSENDVTFINSLVAEGLDVIDEFSTKIAQLDNLVANAGDASQNTEIVDARVDNDGTAHTTVGANLRYTQDNWLKIVVAYDKPVSDITTGQLHIDEAINHKTIYRICNSNGANIGWLICAAVAANTYWKMQIRALYFGELSYRTKDFSTEGSTWSEWIKFETGANKVTSMSSSSTNTQYPTAKAVYDALLTKVDKVEGKVLSTNDYTTSEKDKLAGIEAEATKTVVDSALSSSSENPVQNKAVYAALYTKANANHSHPEYLTQHQDVSGKENTSNKANSITNENKRSTTLYPSLKAVADYADGLTPDLSAQMKRADPSLPGIVVPIDSNSEPDMTSNAFSNVSVGQIFVCIVDEKPAYWLKESASSCKNLGSGGGLSFDSGYVDRTTGEMHLTKNGIDIVGFTPFFVGAGSGGGVGINLTNVVKPSSVRNGANAIFSLTATATDDTNITISWYVNGVIRVTEEKTSGSTFSFNAKDYLRQSDTSSVQASITSVGGASITRQWSITSTAFSLVWGATIQPITLYTTNEDVYAAITVSAQPYTENIVTVSVNQHSVSKSVVGSSDETFKLDKAWFSSGVNTVEASMVSATDENDEADPISYKAIWGYGASFPIVAFEVSTLSVSQYDVAKINYMVYDPAHETASCTIQIGSESARDLSPNRTMKTMNYVPEDYGTKTATLTCGASSTTMTLNISRSQYNIGKITGDNLRFNLDPTGHSNSDADKTSFCNIVFSPGFDWVNGGFHTDSDGAAAFVVKKGHRATLPREIFGDADGNGKTVDISFCIRNSDLFDAVAMQELNNGATKGLILRSNEGELRLNNSSGKKFKYCEDSRIDMSINVESINGHRVMTVWLDGVQSQANKYSAGTLVQDENPLVIGSDHCDVWVYAIRVYNSSLSIKDMIQNYVSLAPTTSKKIQRFRENNVYDGKKITPASLHAARPDLTIITIGAAKIPEGKGDEHYVDAEITIQNGSTVLTLANGARYRDQGTSTMAYGRSAYNMDIEFSGSGKTYKISSNSIPVTYLNIKVNVPSSDNANNVNGADWYNTHQPYLVPGRSTPGVRDTIEGKPCAVFFTNKSNRNVWAGSQLVEPDETVLYAMGDLCNSKKNYSVFAQDGTGEHYAKGCIEVSNNDTDAAKFKATSTYNPNADNGKGRWESVVQTDTGTKIVKDFEWRKRPKAEDLEEVINAWNTAVAWVVSTDGDYEKFVNEVDNYFAIDSLLYHFLYLEFFGGYDNVSKNTFYSYEWDERLQQYVFNITKNYDDDTILGCDNDGVPLCDYGADFGDKDGTREIFNADTNTIWVNIQAGFYSRLATMYKTLRGLGAFSALDIIEKWDNYQSVRPRAAMAQDAYNKYILPWKTDHVIVAGEEQTYDDTYLVRCQGSKTYPRKQFITYQVKYMDGKYGYYITSATTNFRANSPVGTTKNLSVKSYAKSYVMVIVDNEPMTPRKVEAGGTAVFSGVPVHSNTTIYFTPESLIESITPIDDAHITTFKAAGASKLIEATLGNAESENEGWNINGELSAPSPILKTFSIRNIVNFSSDLDLSSNVELESVDTRGTKAGIITLPSFAPVRTANLNACSGITALNLNAVETFSMASGNNLTEIHIENCNSVVNNAMLTYITQAANAGGNATRYIRMTGINWELNNPRVLNAIASKWKGYNSMGEQVDTPYLAGSVHVSTMSSENWTALSAIFPDLTITYDDELPIFTVTFKNYDGTTLNTQRVEQGSAPVDPRELSVNPISTPVQPSSTSTTYTFDGWSWSNGGTLISDLSAIVITADSVIYAHYASAVRKYTVSWKDGSDVIETQQVDYGAEAIYSGNIPVSQSDGDYGMYKLFKGWDKCTSRIVEDTIVQAVWDSKSEPVNKTLSQMTATELHALIMTGVLSPTGANNTVISSGDTIDIIAGHDFDFDNVDSVELIEVSDPKTFDGESTYFKPQIDGADIKLFDTDKSFVLAIDFAYNTSSAAGGCLASCYGSNNGFMLRYSSGGQFRYGASANLQVSSNGVRQMVVIRKIAGDNKLYVYASNKNANALVYSTLEQALVPSHNEPLCFGAQMDHEGYLENYGKGTVYWAKIWNADLGDTLCRQLAAWPRQKFTMQAVGSAQHAFRNFKRVDNQRYVNCAFLLKDLLEETHVIDPANSNAGGFKNRPMRTWLNTRVLNALPVMWQQLILTVYVHTNTGYQATTIVDPPAEDKIWIPSCKEVGFNVNTSPYSLESDATFTVFTNDTSRIKKLNLGTGAANIYWLRSPYTNYTTGFYSVAAAGSSYTGNSSGSYGVAFGFCI